MNPYKPASVGNAGGGGKWSSEPGVTYWVHPSDQTKW